MRVLSPELDKLLNSEVIHVAMCWCLKLTNGKVLGFTSCEYDLIIDEVMYFASSASEISAIQSANDFTVNNLEISGIIDNELISEEDIIQGMYDHAEIESFVVDYLNPSAGKIILNKGYIGEINIKNGKFIADIRGKLQKIASATIGEVYSPNCRANFADLRCQVDLTPYRYVGKISKLINNNSFIDEDLKNDIDYTKGQLTIISGKNAGLVVDVLRQNGGQIELNTANIKLSEGQEYSIIPGCDKKFSTCCINYNNSINFRGEPHLHTLRL